MQRHAKLVNRTVSFINRPIDRPVLIEPTLIEPLTASVEEREHRTNAVPESVCLLRSEERIIHANISYMYTLVLSRGSMTRR
jgi:hypothetical protein